MLTRARLAVTCAGRLPPNPLLSLTSGSTCRRHISSVLCLKNLRSTSTIESDVQRLLSPYGTILRTTVHSLNPKLVNNGATKAEGVAGRPPSLTAYVEFSKVEEAIAAKDELDMSWDGGGNGRKRIFVNFCSLTAPKWKALDDKVVHPTLTRNQRKKEFNRMKAILDWKPPTVVSEEDKEEALNDLVLEAAMEEEVEEEEAKEAKEAEEEEGRRLLLESMYLYANDKEKKSSEEADEFNYIQANL
mmetsp:Transcript_26297/g.49759  ORF Transcript_26297/g.49759 Transcript_26297/m.49759 type:complete len:245 (+) Transcript_26297:196-930(+)